MSTPTFEGDLKMCQAGRDPTPVVERFVSGEQEQIPLEVALVRHLEQDVRRTRAIAEIAHLINHQDMGLEIELQCQGAVRSDTEGINQISKYGKASDTQMGFASSGGGASRVRNLRSFTEFQEC